MKYLVDTCGWIEWATDSKLARQFEPFLRNPKQLLVPTLIQFELYRWIEREQGEETALEIIGITEQAEVIPLSTRIALYAAEMSKQHKLAMADAIIYASARSHETKLITSDKHFKGLELVNYFSK